MKIKIIITLGILSALSLTFFWQQHSKGLMLKPASFNELPGWGSADLKKSLQTFKVSCSTFLRQDPEHKVGSKQIRMQVKDWQPACQAAMTLSPITDITARNFFKTWFQPVAFYENSPVDGLFTGYYLPQLKGSLTQTKTYSIPIYALPEDMLSLNLQDFDKKLPNKRLIARLEKGKIQPYFTREEINQGKLKAKVLVWVNNPVDRLFLEIQGSGIVTLDNGQKLYLGYAGENGAPYTPVGKVLVEKGIMTKDTASMQGIRAYLEAHPEEMDEVINQNKSFVFFRLLKQTAALGAQGVQLTPGYSLAVDRKWIPLGTPLWLDTTRPIEDADDELFQRLMIAQDTGGAIRGKVRGDVFWGAGKTATYTAGTMKNQGHYWLLLPKHTIAYLPKTLGN